MAMSVRLAPRYGRCAGTRGERTEVPFTQKRPSPQPSPHGVGRGSKAGTRYLAAPFLRRFTICRLINSTAAENAMAK